MYLQSYVERLKSISYVAQVNKPHCIINRRYNIELLGFAAEKSAKTLQIGLSLVQKKFEEL